MIKSFDRQNLSAIRKDLEEILGQFAKQHGLSVSVGNIRFSPTEFGTRLQVRVNNGGGLEEVSRYAPISSLGLGFKDEDMGKVVTIRGKKYEVVGCKPRAWKMPMIVKDVRSGKLFKMQASDVAKALGMEKEKLDLIKASEGYGRGSRYDD